MADSKQAKPAPGDTTTALVRLHVWQIQAVRDVMLLAAIIALVWAGYAIRAVTVPLLIALTLAYLFEPLVARLTRNPKASRPFVVAGLLTIVGGVVILVLIFTVPRIVSESSQFIQEVRAGRFRDKIIQAGEYVPERYRKDYESAVRMLMPDASGLFVSAAPGDASTRPALEVGTVTTLDEQRVRELVREELELHNEPAAAKASAPGSVMELVRGGSRAALRFLGTIVQLGLLAFLIPFYFFFFSVSYPAVARFGRNLIPESNRVRTLELIGKMDRAVAGFVRGRLLICLITGVMLSILWMLVGVPYAIVLGLITGAFFMVPFLSGIGIPVAVGLLLLQQVNLPADERMAWWAIVLWPTLMFVIVNAIETWVLTPVIAGKATNLDPVTILVAVLAGGSVGGAYGMLLAIPAAACLKILVTDVILPRIKRWVKGEVKDPLPLS